MRPSLMEKMSDKNAVGEEAEVKRVRRKLTEWLMSWILKQQGERAFSLSLSLSLLVDLFALLSSQSM